MKLELQFTIIDDDGNPVTSVGSVQVLPEDDDSIRSVKLKTLFRTMHYSAAVQMKGETLLKDTIETQRRWLP